MAFLCPVRIKRNRKKKPQDEDVVGPVTAMGRITGSASIETLVRVGIEKEMGFGPEAKMVVLHDFTPCVDDELEVKRGQVVHVLYQENDWVYVISENEQEGFIPHSYCSLYGSQLATLALNVKKKLPRDFVSLPHESTTTTTAPTTTNNVCTPNINKEPSTSSSSSSHKQNQFQEAIKSRSLETANRSAVGENEIQDLDRRSNIKSNHKPAMCQPEITPFKKSGSGGLFVVLYTYLAQDENDLTVERGQIVTLLNSEDPDWYWVSRYDSHEGFVPSGFIYPLDAIHRHYGLNNNNSKMTSQYQPHSLPTTTSAAIVPPPLPSSSMSSMPPEVLEPVPMPSGSSVGSSGNHDIRHSGTELIMLYDYKAQAPDDLTVKRGDWVYADLNNQTVDGWLWTYAAKSQRYGFIPKAYARPPAMTSL